MKRSSSRRVIPGARRASPANDGADAFYELVGRDGLEQEAAGAGADRVIDVLVEVKGREHQHLGRRVGAGE